MNTNALLRGLGFPPSPDRHATSYSSSSKMQPLYSRLESRDHAPSSSPSTYDDDDTSNDRVRALRRPSSSSSSRPLLALPTPTRFLADFTLGFADGLTVPFALTAGLSSLGQTDTVIYAGMAEICAGSISMGIGGYLAARGEALGEDDGGDNNSDGAGEPCADEEAEKGFALPRPAEDGDEGEEEVAARYLAPLDLPEALRDEILAHVASRPHVAGAIASRQTERRRPGGGTAVDGRRRCSPVVAGLSVALGYLLGGLLPLFPYFFVSRVGDGLLWSFVVCLLALFLFGFSKDFFAVAAARLAREKSSGGRRAWGRVPWRRIRRSIWEGVQMVILGGAAAIAAVLCVRLFEGFNVAR